MIINHHKPMGLIMVYLSIPLRIVLLEVHLVPRIPRRSCEDVCKPSWLSFDSYLGCKNWTFQWVDGISKTLRESLQRRYVATLWLHPKRVACQRSACHSASMETFASQVSTREKEPGAARPSAKPTAGLSRKKRNWRVREWCESIDRFNICFFLNVSLIRIRSVNIPSISVNISISIGRNSHSLLWHVDGPEIWPLDVPVAPLGSNWGVDRLIPGGFHILGPAVPLRRRGLTSDV